MTLPFDPPLRRSMAIVTLAGASLALGLAGASAQTSTATKPGSTKPPAAAAATSSKPQTVEQRITMLKSALKITPEQEKQWNGVAQAMRENATTMDKLVAAKRTTPPQNMSAVEDLKTYQEFAQAHVDGLKNLIGSFGTLYDAMPAAQKKIADTVFNTSGREPAPLHG